MFDSGLGSLELQTAILRWCQVRAPLACSLVWAPSGCIRLIRCACTWPCEFQVSLIVFLPAIAALGGVAQWLLAKAS